MSSQCKLTYAGPAISSISAGVDRNRRPIRATYVDRGAACPTNLFLAGDLSACHGTTCAFIQMILQSLQLCSLWYSMLLSLSCTPVCLDKGIDFYSYA